MLNIIYLKTDELIPYDRNPRYNDEAVDAVAKSIKEFGFRVPIVVDANHVIIAGHTRAKGAKVLGMEEVPCIVADDLTPEQIKAFRIADNKTAEIAKWDYELLPIELKELQTDGFDLSLLGFDTTELERACWPTPTRWRRARRSRTPFPTHPRSPSPAQARFTSSAATA